MSALGSWFHKLGPRQSDGFLNAESLFLCNFNELTGCNFIVAKLTEGSLGAAVGAARKRRGRNVGPHSSLTLCGVEGVVLLPLPAAPAAAGHTRACWPWTLSAGPLSGGAPKPEASQPACVERHPTMYASLPVSNCRTHARTHTLSSFLTCLHRHAHTRDLPYPPMHRDGGFDRPAGLLAPGRW